MLENKSRGTKGPRKTSRVLKNNWGRADQAGGGLSGFSGKFKKVVSGSGVSTQDF